MRMLCSGSLARAVAACWLAALPGPTLASITGVCPDGSIYIVQHESQIPCEHSKAVAPSQVPPVRPQYLPKPYTWQVWTEQNDPNNPYNLVEAANQVRAAGAGAAPTPPGTAAAEAAPAPGTATAPQPAQPARELGPSELGLGEQELADLFAIVELSQELAPAHFERSTAAGDGVATLSFAHSLAFEERLQSALAGRGGAAGRQVLLFAARSDRSQEFYPNFTFVQSPLTYQPDATSSSQLGVLQGHLGALGEGEVVLGYVVLPDSLDLAKPVEIYWDDRHTVAQF